MGVLCFAANFGQCLVRPFELKNASLRAQGLSDCQSRSQTLVAARRLVVCVCGPAADGEMVDSEPRFRLKQVKLKS